MFRLLICLAVVGIAFTGFLPDDLDGRIVNGVDTTIESHPYQVSLQRTQGSHFCGGSVIGPDTIVTAAHCLQGIKTSEFQVRLGSTTHNDGGELIAVKAFKTHPGYNPQIMINDVGVIKLATPVEESTRIRFIDLAEKTPETGTPAVVTGWGTKCYMTCFGLPTTLQVVDVDIVHHTNCSSKDYKYGSAIQETMVCAYATEKDACQGDSGGPLVAKNKLVGVVSWGNGCARDGYPGVYGEVSSLRDWIVETTKSL